jgi:hypothetical protein
MVKIKNILFIVSLFTVSFITAQDYKFGYLVEFTDKDNTQFSIDNPDKFLSERAIERRNKFNIQITSQDFPVNKTYIDSIVKLGASMHVTSRWMNSAVFYTDSVNFPEKVANISFVSNCKLVYKKDGKKSVLSQNKFKSISGNEIYGNSYTQIAMCNAQKLHQKGFKGKGIQIAVLDGGFHNVNTMECFDSLYANNRILGSWDFVSHNSNVFDDHTHGMGVLSIMGGNLPGQLMGTAPEASYYLFRTENVYSEYPIEGENWIAAAERADSAGVDIITASLGYGSFDDETMSYTYSDMDGKTTRITKGAEIAFSKGIFLVNSAGNEGTSTWHYITAPSDGEHVLCVGAVAANKIIAPFSSRGPSADNRVKPDVTAMGMGTALIYADGTVGSGNGTSYSCPVMAGMIACLLQALPEKSNIEILNLVREISDRYDTPDNDYGYGIPDFSKLSFLIDSSNYNKESDDNIVAAYPNPFVDKIKLNLFINKSQTIKIVLYNNFGEKVYYTEKHFLSDSYNLVILGDLPKLQRGFYFLSVYTEQKILSAKIVKE